MTILLDTNILSRVVQPAHAHHAIALGALDSLKARGETLVVVPQILYEFWVVCTRPVGENGLGLGTAEAQHEQAKVLSLFGLLPDSAAIFTEWQRLVLEHDVKGKNAHDARLVAAMLVHGLSHLLTFNGADFSRYPGVTVLSPASFVPLPDSA